MKSIRFFIILSLAAMLLLGLPVEGEAGTPVWPVDGVPVCVTPDYQTDPIIVPDGNGGAIVAWSDSKTGQTFIQRLNGEGIPKWAQNGIEIVDDYPGTQYTKDIIPDGSSGAIIVWADSRSDAPGIYAQRIDSSGSRVWGDGGIAIIVSNNISEPRLTSDGAGGTIITYKNSFSGIIAQRINASGEKQWGANGIVVNAVTNFEDPQIVSDGVGGAVLAWQDNRTYSDYNLYSQRIDGDGALMWTADGVPICTAPGTQAGPQIIPRSGGGAIIAWVDVRLPGDNEIYAQYVNGSGVVQWTSNGVPVCINPGTQSFPAIVSDGQNGAIITWVDNRSGGYGGENIYAQRMNASGSRLWGNSGLPMCTSTSQQKEPVIASDNNGGAFIAWGNMVSSCIDDIGFQSVDASGHIGMGPDGAKACISEGGQAEPSICSDGKGGAVVVWEDSRGFGPSSDIYAQRLSPGDPYTTWYLAEGCTGEGFETWILVQNPGDDPVDIDMVFQTDTGPVQGPQGSIPANSRKTYNAAAYVESYNVSTKVTASGSIVCERAMYGNNRAWGHDSIGVISPSPIWYLAEGCTAGGFETWVLVQNPGDDPVDIDMVFQTDTGPVQGPQSTIPANSRKTYNVGEYVQSYNVSTMVTANNGYIICERAMYGNNRSWGHDSVGVTSPASTWALAEGCTAGGFETWVLLQNPHDRSMEVEIFFLTDTEVVQGPQEVIPANSRVTYNAGEYVQSYFVSTIVDVTTDYGSVICERAMYGSNRAWGHDSTGAPFASNTWLLAEGCTGPDFETWILLQNPSDQEMAIDMMFMTDTDIVQGPQDNLPPFSRKSYNVGDYVTSCNVSTLVFSNNGFFNCERSMYGNSRTWGHNSPGFIPLFGFPSTAQAAGAMLVPLDLDSI